MIKFRYNPLGTFNFSIEFKYVVRNLIIIEKDNNICDLRVHAAN